MGQNFGCNCMDRKDDSKNKGNMLPRQHYQREFQIEGYYEQDKSLVWFMNQQRGMQKQQETYVLKNQIIDLNSSFLTESNKSFMINGERINTHKDSHCSFSEDSNTLSYNYANKFKIIQLSNNEIFNYLNKCKDVINYNFIFYLSTTKIKLLTEKYQRKMPYLNIPIQVVICYLKYSPSELFYYIYKFQVILQKQIIYMFIKKIANLNSYLYISSLTRQRRQYYYSLSQ